MSETHGLIFIKAMEINGISPLPHYYEEIYPNQRGLEKIGLRGDENYLFYSVDGHGAGYYEQHEMALATQSTFDYFQKTTNRQRFFEGIQSILTELRDWDAQIEATDLANLSDKEIATLFVKANQLHGDIFSYYVVSQPYRIKRFEDVIKAELRKRVAGSRIDHYLSLLATSEKPTKVTEEEIDWLKLLIAAKKRYGETLEEGDLADRYPDLQAALGMHFETYKTLTLGDGVWEYDPQYYVNNFRTDYAKDILELEARHQQITGYADEVVAARQRLIEELYLPPETVSLLELLADIGHSRFVMRTDGWIPHVRIVIKLDIELSKRLGYRHNVLNFMTEEELTALAEDWAVLPEEVLLERRGENAEFLILNDRGTYRLLFGAEAGEAFRSRVPEIDHDTVTELIGTTAVLGKITDRVCVYNWGDDLAEKIAAIKKYPILVAGQTRPSMMPLIRLAKGIITDEGGVTSHAAIVSRELGIPSVIGTTYATKVFHDGDTVELDADAGKVRKIS